MIENVLEIINIILENRSKEKLSSISLELRLREDLGFDSLDLAELTVRLEAEYNIDIFENGIINSIKEILEKLEKKS